MHKYTAIILCNLYIANSIHYIVYSWTKKGSDFVAIKSEAQKKAVARYNAANYDQILLRVEKGKRAAITKYAESRGESLNAFINRAIDEAMERDNEE